jgi:hypothetical protein
MTNVKQLDKQVVREIAGRSEHSKAFFEYLDTRERNARDGKTPIAYLKKDMAESGFRAVPEEILEDLRALERAGIGQLVMSPKGNYFKWFFGLKEVAAAAAVRRMKTPEKQAPRLSLVPPTRTVLIQFGTGRQFEASFPPDLTEQEVALVCKHIGQKHV